MKKRILSGLVTILLIISLLPATPLPVQAATSGYYTYSVSSGEATITDCSTSISGDITIPTTLGGYPVISIGNYAFDGCTGLASVTIGNSVESIGSFAFADCTGLTSIIIPDSVTSIGESAFYYCSGLTSITIPDSVTSIGISSTFCYCVGLTSVTIGNSVESICGSAFEGCTGLTGVTIPDSVTSIGWYSFLGCTGLTSITIPDSVVSIAYGAFYNCTGLTDVNYGGTEEQWNAISIDSANTPLTDATIHFSKPVAPDTTDYEYTVENGEATITSYLGSGGNITIPATLDSCPVTSIGDYAFYKCTGLTGVTIPDSVTNIGEYAFSGCTGLTSVSIPDSITSMGGFVFAFCDSLTYNIYNNGEYLGNRNNPYLVFLGPTSGNITAFQIHTNTKIIYSCAFSYISSLSSITIPDSVTCIGEEAFYECTGLISVTIPGSVTSIGGGAFSGCTGLASVTIPDSVTSIGMGAYSGCTGLTDVNYGGTEEQWNAISIGNYNDPLRNANIHFVVNGVSNGDETFETLQEALDAYETGTIQLQADAGSVTVIKDAVVDLNGFDIASVTVTAGTLTVLDSKTDDYSVADNDYGKIADLTGNITPAEGYIAIAEADGTSYHRITLEINDMVLRSADAGVYYKCTFNGDEMVAEQVTSYGVALSVRGTPEIGAFGTQYSTFTEFTSGANTPSTLLKNVMKETNTAAQNNRNADMQVYGRAYIQIGDSYIYGETVSRSFREQVELVDTIWSTLTTEQQTAVLTMYRTFQENMSTWTIPNIKASI